MRTLKIVSILAVLLLADACKKTEKPEVESSAGSPPLPPITSLNVARENITVWVDANRSDLHEKLADMDARRDRIGTLQPLLYGVGNGKIFLHGNIGVNTVDDIVHMATKRHPPIQVRPTFGNVDYAGTHGDEITKLLSTPTLTKEAIETIEKVAADPRFAGVDIDWEEIPLGSHESFVKFLKEVGARVHKLQKTVSVAFEPGTPSDLIRQAGEVADYIEILAYPMHHPGTGPGPLSPVSFVKEHIIEALKVVPRSKIILGLPFYGYTWEVWPEGHTYTNEVTWQEFQKIRQGDGGRFREFKDNRDKDGTPGSTYAKCLSYNSTYGCSAKPPATVTAWYEDAHSINAKMKMATGEEFRITRFAFWQIGGEDPAIWEMLK